MAGRGRTPAEADELSGAGASRSELTRVATVVFLVALAARFAFVLVARGDPEIFRGLFLDSARYVDIARSIRAGEGAGDGPYLLSPLYPYFLALFSFEGPAEAQAALAVRIVQAALGAGTCALVAIAALQLAGERAAWIAGIIAATYAPAILYDVRVLVAGPQAFSLALALVLALHGEASDDPRRAMVRWLAAGVALGVGAALRPTVLAVLAAWALVLALRPSDRRSRILRVGALLLGAAVVIAPFTARNSRVAGQSVLLSASGGFNFWVGNHAEAPGIFVPPPGYDFQGDPVGRELAASEAGVELSYSGASRWWRDRAFDDIAAAPTGWIAGLGRKLVLFFHPREIPQLGASFEWYRGRCWVLRGPLDARWILILALLCPLALHARGGRRALADSALPGAMLCAYAATIVCFFVSGRHRAPVMPVAIVAAALTVDATLRLLAEPARRARGGALGAAFAGLAIASLVLFGSGDRAPFGDAEAQRLRQAGLSLLAEGRAREAVEQLEASLTAAENLTTRIALAEALDRAGRGADARSQFRRVLAVEPAHARAAFGLANLLQGTLRGEMTPEKLAAARESERLYRVATGAQPRFAEAWFNLGAALMKQRRFDEAIAAIETALQAGSIADAWRPEAERVLLIAYDRRRDPGEQ